MLRIRRIMCKAMCLIIPFTYLPFINFPFENCRFHRRLFFPWWGGKIHSFPTNVYNFQRWEWVFGCGIARASNLQLLEIGETVAFFSLSLAHDNACWDRLTCNILPLLNSTEKSETIYIYFLITIWRHEEKWIECLRKWFAHHVLSITRKYQSDAGCLHAERNDTKFIRT